MHRMDWARNLNGQRVMFWLFSERDLRDRRHIPYTRQRSTLFAAMNIDHRLSSLVMMFLLLFLKKSSKVVQVLKIFIGF